MAETCYNRAETRRNSYSDPCSNAIYSQFSAWTYTILGIIRKGTSVRSVWHHCHLRKTYCTHQTSYYVKHSKFIILAITLRRGHYNLLNLADSCHVYGYIYLPSFIEIGIKIAILEQVEVILEFSRKWRIWRAFFSNLVSVRVYNFVYGWKGHIFKYLNPKKGTVLPSHYGDTATERKPIPRTLEGAIYVLHSHWSMKFGMAMCNYEIRIMWDLNTKRNLYEKVMAVLDF